MELYNVCGATRSSVRVDAMKELNTNSQCPLVTTQHSTGISIEFNLIDPRKNLIRTHDDSFVFAGSYYFSH
jgi:hypothetical protein